MKTVKPSHALSLAIFAAGVGLSSGAAAAPTIEELRSSAKKPPKEPAEALTLARALRRAGLFAEAANAARSGFARGGPPESIADLKLELSRISIDQGNYKKAQNECTQIAKLSKLKEKLCIAESQLLGRRGSVALPAAEEALAIDPGHYDALIAKGRALRQLGRPEEAEKALREAISADVKRREAHRFLGELFLDRAQTDKALAALKTARQLDRDDPEVLLLLGETLTPGPEALDALNQALSVRPGFARARARLGVVLLETGQLDAAEGALREALKLESRQADWHAALGRVALAKKKPQDALKAAADALKIVGNHGAAKLVEARALSQNGEIDLAIVAFEAAYGLARSNPEVLVEAARACLERGRPTTAQAFAERATQEFADWGPAWVVAGEVAAAAGERKGARAAFEKALSAKGPVDKAAVRRKLADLK